MRAPALGILFCIVRIYTSIRYCIVEIWSFLEGGVKGGDSEAGGTMLRLAVLRAWAELYIACESGWLDSELERHVRKLAAADKAVVHIGMPIIFFRWQRLSSS